MLSPFSSLARAPYLHRIGATSAVASASLSCLHCNALWQSSVLSSKISQNFLVSPPDDSATSGRFIVTTPWLNLPQYFGLLVSGSTYGVRNERHPQFC